MAKSMKAPSKKTAAKSPTSTAAKTPALAKKKAAAKTAAAKHGSPFVWYDLATTNMKAAEAFYKSVFGWTAKDSGHADQNYTLFSTKDRMIAGLMPMPDDTPQAMPPCWTGYIGVDDIDACLSKLKAAGGIVHKTPWEVPGVGRMAVAADPHGAVFMPFQPSSSDPNPPVAANTHGHMGWHELYAGNLTQAWTFYSKVFGWAKSTAMDMGPMGTYQLFAVDGADIGGMMTKPPEAPAPSWLYYVNVDALDAAIARVTKGKGKVVMGPMEVPGGQWVAQCTDPQGAMFAMVSAKR